MDLQKIKSRLDRLNNPGGGKSSDFKANFWKAPVGEKSQIRLVPYKHNKDFPFSELYFYFGIGKPRMIALTNFEESDPIMEFASQLRKTGEKDNIELSKSDSTVLASSTKAVWLGLTLTVVVLNILPVSLAGITSTLISRPFIISVISP